MARKVQSIHITSGHMDRDKSQPGSKTVYRYQVVKVVNSVAYTPGQWLTERDVADLCNHVAWNVTITQG
jgi:hypothetical protein